MKLIDIIYEYDRAELQDSDNPSNHLQNNRKRTLKSIESELLALVGAWCYCEDGFTVTGGMAMEDDLVEKMPCEDCHELRQRISDWCKGEQDNV